MFCLHECMCTSCVPDAFRGQKRAFNPLEWLLSHHVGAGNWTCTRILYKTDKCSNLLSQLHSQPHHKCTFVCVMTYLDVRGQWCGVHSCLQCFYGFWGSNQITRPCFYPWIHRPSPRQGCCFVGGVLLFFICLFLMCLCVSLYVGVWIWCGHVHESGDILRDQRCQIPWTWSYRWLWAPLHEC